MTNIGYFMLGAGAVIGLTVALFLFRELRSMWLLFSGLREIDKRRKAAHEVARQTPALAPSSDLTSL
jgi:hypothetical protein